MASIQWSVGLTFAGCLRKDEDIFVNVWLEKGKSIQV